VKCPVCDVDLLMSERQGVEIDYCPSCRGVWLDRGELDKIVERVNTEYAPPRPAEKPQAAAPAAFDGGDPGREQRTYHGDSHHGDSHKKKQKKPSSFLSDIFEGLGG
jgi:Zn-finger nucleic acid-binding protein